MKRLKKELKPFKLPLILIGVFGLLYLIMNFVMPAVNNHLANKTPIVAIEATNERVYKQGSKFRESDFVVKAEHESGKFSTLSSDKFTITPKKPDVTGDYTNVTVTLKGDRSKKATLKVQNDRKPIVTIPCGKPDRDAVKAVIYSNGELAFEGEGDVLQYNTNEFPWKTSGDIAITAVTFDDRITPTSMDYWFSGMGSLVYVDTLPASVESIVGMCSGCASLETAPNWNASTNLLDVTEAYAECSSLKNVPPLTGSIKNATSMLENCIALEKAPDMARAESLRDMTNFLRGCESLTTATTMPPNVEKMDAAFADCINLKQMPDIPGSVKSMDSSFINNVSLREVKTIPSGVENAANCFAGCNKIKGSLRVDATPKSYGGFLLDACRATNLDLTGTSQNLNELALTNNTENVTINGSKPVREDN